MSFYAIESKPIVRSRLAETDGRIVRNTDTAETINNAVNMGILGWAFTGANREGLYNQNSGNVGIGNVNPQAKLDITGDVAISSFLDVYDNITSTNGDIDCSSGNITAYGNIISTAGSIRTDIGNVTISDGKLIVRNSLPNPIIGTATLVAGTVTVATTKASLANSYGFATHKVFAGTPGVLSITTGNGSVTITSSNGGDTSTVNWVLFN